MSSKLDLSVPEATALYWCSWLLAIATKIVLLPIASLTYLESSTEFRHPTWSIPASQASLPVISTETPFATAPGGVLDRASSSHNVPIERQPSLSSVRRRPG